MICSANENWGRSRKTRKEEDPDIADLIKKMNDIQAYIVNMEQDRGFNRPVKWYNSRRSEPTTGANTIQPTCYRCDEEGHFANSCMAETD